MKAQELRDFRKEAVRTAFCKIYQAVKKNGHLDKIKTDLVLDSIHSYLTILSLGNMNEKIGEGLGIYVSYFFNSLKPSIQCPDRLYLGRVLHVNYEFSQICKELSGIDPRSFSIDIAFKDSTKNEALNFFKTSAENFVDKTLKLNLVNSGDDINHHLWTQNMMIREIITETFLPSDISSIDINGLDVQDIKKFLEARSDLDIVEYEYGTRKAFKRIFEKNKDNDLELEF